MVADEQKTENSNPKLKNSADAETESASFPWLMLIIAAFFDLLGAIPFINFFSELVAGLILGLWQKNYAPITDPFLTFFITKIADIFSLGLLPSNIAVVVYAYLQKKAAAVKGKLQPLADSRYSS